MIEKVTSPEEFFGFQLGSDREIARWDKMVEYFGLLEKQSDKIKVTDMGPSTEGNPFLLVIISSPKNLANLEHIREVNAKISDPRGLSDDEINALIEEGRAVICQTMGLHATELGGTQMAPELAYDLLNRSDEETRRILENVVFLLVPCSNPDGQIMITDWYDRWLGTEYEGCNLPWLYHKYVGHDNNRDAFQTNMIESQYLATILLRDWKPQAYCDHHHMGSYGARLYVPPHNDPIHPHADPLFWRESAWYGAHMAYKLEEAGKIGVVSGAEFPGWENYGNHNSTRYHNIAGLLTESASAKLATPMYIHPNQLNFGIRGPLRRRTFPHYKPMATFPSPWPGGWWSLRDIVEQKKIASWAILDLAARHKETVLRNAYLKAIRQSERGAKGNPYAYVIPRSQHDPLTAEKLVQKLLVQGIEINIAKKELVIDDVTYPEGTYVIFLGQPKMGAIRSLLGRTFFPDDAWTRMDDGTPMPSIDTATDTMAEYMGVRVDPIQSSFVGDFEVITDYNKPMGKLLGKSQIGYVFDGRLNDSFKAVNKLLGKGVKLQRVDEEVEVGGIIFPPGAFVAPAKCEETLKEVAQEIGLDFHALEEELEAEIHDVEQLRVGIYQRYWGGNMDEGWTRWILEQFEFPYKTLMDDDIKKGDLKKWLDVIILPDDQTPLITGDGVEDWSLARGRPLVFPPEYRSGIGDEGINALNKFIENGGTLVMFNQTCEFALEKLGLKVRNVVKGLEPKEFLCSGSTLKAKVDTTNALGYGMPKDALILHWESPVYEILPSMYNEKYEVIVSYPEHDILQSGRLIGEDKIAGKIAMLSIQCGDGRTVLIGFRPQHRGQTHGTYKTLFNTLIG